MKDLKRDYLHSYAENKSRIKTIERKQRNITEVIDNVGESVENDSV
jgi:vacuolar-type H+-ATPase subunit E/Vma4